MPAYAKEESEQDPLEDELNIKTVFAKAGFSAQQRVRMLLSQPPASKHSFVLAIGMQTAASCTWPLMTWLPGVT